MKRSVKLQTRGQFPKVATELAYYAFTKVDGLRCHHEAHTIVGKDHDRACIAMTNSATRAAGVVEFTSTLTEPTTKSIDTA